MVTLYKVGLRTLKGIWYTMVALSALYGLSMVLYWAFDKTQPFEFYTASYTTKILRGQSVDMLLEMRQHRPCQTEAVMLLKGACQYAEIPVKLGDLENSLASSIFHTISFELPSTLQGQCPAELVFTYRCNPFQYVFPLRATYVVPALDIP